MYSIRIEWMFAEIVFLHEKQKEVDLKKLVNSFSTSYLSVYYCITNIVNSTKVL